MGGKQARILPEAQAANGGLLPEARRVVHELAVIYLHLGSRAKGLRRTGRHKVSFVQEF